MRFSGPMMTRLDTSIEIEAPAKQIWAVLTDFSSYPEWNPFVRSVEGELETGRRLHVRLEPPGLRGMTLRPKLVAVDPPRAFRWHGHLGVPGLFDGEHGFEIEPLASGRVRFRQSEEFRGVLVPLLWRMLETKTRRGFEAMNAALKRRAERGTAVPEQRNDSA